MSVIGSSDLDVLPIALGANTFGWTADHDESFDLAVDVFLRGLPALMPCSHEYRCRSTHVEASAARVAPM